MHQLIESRVFSKKILGRRPWCGSESQAYFDPGMENRAKTPLLGELKTAAKCLRRCFLNSEYYEQWCLLSLFAQHKRVFFSGHPLAFIDVYFSEDISPHNKEYNDAQHCRAAAPEYGYSQCEDQGT